MTRTWNDLEGVSLGRYWLKVCLTSSADDAWYLIRYDTTRDAAVRVRSAANAGADLQLEYWRKALALDHPHVVRMLDAGRAPAEGDDFLFCVCEYPDDFLAAALRDRPLTPTETREVLDATLSALGYLHEQNLVHGAVDSTHIMAFGETIKLPSDTIRPAEGEISTASDMRSLGLLVHEMLMREVPRPDAETDFSYLPEPFRSIVRNTVKAEGQPWTVGDVRAHLSPPPPPKPQPIIVSEPAAAPVAEAMEPVAEPVRAIELPPAHRRSEIPIERGFPLKWVPITGLTAAVVLGAFVLRRPDARIETPTPETVSPPAVAGPAPVRENPPKPSPAPRSTQPPAPAQSRDRTATGDARPSTTSPVWRVIAYTYNGRSNAEKKARSLNEKRPGWHAEVFTPKGDRAPYFVSLGGRMTLAEAERVQRDARAKGLPRDTFVRNFTN